MRIEEKGRNKDVVKLKEKERDRKRVTFFLTRIVHSLTRLVSIGALGNKDIYFFPSGHGNESYNLIGSDHGHSNACVSFFSVSFFFV